MVADPGKNTTVGPDGKNGDGRRILLVFPRVSSVSKSLFFHKASRG